MTNKELLLLALVIYVGYRYQRSHNGTSVVDQVWMREAANIGAMNGTNFIQSVWDPVSGQPGYMFGAVPAPGGTAVTPNAPQYSSIFGHM